MGIHNHIRHNALRSERQVLLPVRHSAGSFLAVAGCELVTNLRHFDCPHFDFHKAFVLIVSSQDNLIYIAFLRMLEWSRLIFKRLLFARLVVDTCSVNVIIEDIKLGRGYCFTNDDIVANYLICRTDNAIRVQLVVSACLESTCLLRVWLANAFLKALRACVGAVEHTSEEATVDSGLVQHDGVLLIVA